jgi:hypothetical protein
MNRSNRSCAQIALISGILLNSLVVLAAPTTVVISKTGDAAPDGNGLMFGLSVIPAVNDVGQVAFSASQSGTTPQSQTGMFRGSGGPVTQIARAGSAVPGGDGTFGTFFLGPAINNIGQVSFTSDIIGPTNPDSDRGIFRGDGNSLITIARNTQVVPGGNGTIVSLPFENVINDAGQVAFYALLGGTSGGVNDNRALYRGSGGALTQMARKGQIITGVGGIGEFQSFMSMNQAGDCSFVADLVGTAGGTGDNQGIFRSNGTTITQIARKGGALPVGGGSFNSFGSPVLNDLGQVTFRGFLAGTPNGANDDSGIFRNTGGAIVQIARENQAAPDGNGAISFMFLPAQNNVGQSAFTVSYRNSAGGAADDTALLRGSGGALVQVAREGQSVPGGNGKFGTLDSFGQTDFGLNDQGQVAFLANLTNTAGGTSDDTAIYFFDDNLGLLQVAREGQSLLGSTIVSLRLAPGTFGEEVAGINDASQVAFQFGLADNREGIALWSSNIPEPSLMVFGGALVAIGALRRRRR